MAEASPKCSSNCRTRTGPTCSIMFSATSASRESITVAYRIHAARRKSRENGIPAGGSVKYARDFIIDSWKIRFENYETHYFDRRFGLKSGFLHDSGG